MSFLKTHLYSLAFILSWVETLWRFYCIHFVCVGAFSDIVKRFGQSWWFLNVLFKSNWTELNYPQWRTINRSAHTCESFIRLVSSPGLCLRAGFAGGPCVGARESMKTPSVRLPLNLRSVTSTITSHQRSTFTSSSHPQCVIIDVSIISSLSASADFQSMVHRNTNAKSYWMKRR